MYDGSITDVKGILVGNCHDDKAKTGVTAILLENGGVCGVDVRGSAPGTRETDFMKQAMSIDSANAIILSGGSAFGLASADGAMKFCEERKKGVFTGETYVPIIPAAVIYDLGYGSSLIRPDAKMGYSACENASKDFEQGCVGAGCGATVGKLIKSEYMEKSGVGSASIKLHNGCIVGAIVVVNAAGDIFDNGKIIAGAKKDGKYINQTHYLLNNDSEQTFMKTNTTIGVIATNAKLTKDEATKLAQIGHDGLAQCISPVHTSIDGDTLFALSCGNKKYDINVIITATVEAIKNAVANAIYSVNV